jgi:hypothetical protein
LAGIRRAHIELYLPHLHESGLRDSSVKAMRHGDRGFLRFAHIDGPITTDPAVYARPPRVHADETRTQGPDRPELIRFLPVAQTITAHHGAPAYLLGINALRTPETAAAGNEDHQETLRGHRAPAPGRQRQQARHHGSDRPRAACSAGPPRPPCSGPAHPPTPEREADRPPQHLPDGPPDREDRRHPEAHQPALTARTPASHSATRRSSPDTPTHAPPSTTTEPAGNLDRHGVHFLTAYVAGV